MSRPANAVRPTRLIEMLDLSEFNRAVELGYEACSGNVAKLTHRRVAIELRKAMGTESVFAGLDPGLLKDTLYGLRIDELSRKELVVALGIAVDTNQHMSGKI